jgi:homoserine/homoserine lactone efflux protein
MNSGTLAAFALVTGLTSLVPGPQMMFVMTQSAWRGARGGLAALGGLQVGNLLWFVMAGLGLGTLAKAVPAAFTALTIAGALYLAWLGIQALRHAGEGADEGAVEGETPRRAVSGNAMRDSLVVALSNPKSLVYVLALLPPFIDQAQAIAPQIAVLALIAIAFDVAVGLGYIAAGSSLAKAMARGEVRGWLDRGVAAVFLLLAVGVLYQIFSAAGLA